MAIAIHRARWRTGAFSRAAGTRTQLHTDGRGALPDEYRKSETRVRRMTPSPGTRCSGFGLPRKTTCRPPIVPPQQGTNGRFLRAFGLLESSTRDASFELAPLQSSVIVP